MRKCPECAASYEDTVAFCGQDGTITIEIQDEADFDPRLGNQLGSYIVVARIADGGMGRVYEGRHIETKKRVAIKVLHEKIAQDQVAVERLRREYETAEEFDHPNMVRVLDFGETEDGSHFLTMEYLVGHELSKEIEENGALAPARLIRIVCQLGIGLDYAHSFGVIHRDLKPDNIYLSPGETGDDVKILDFGSVKLQMDTGVKLTAMGTTLGSPYYMSPEQAMGKLDVDQRTDVFAIAAVTWELSTAQVAFEGSSLAMILTKIVNEDPPLASEINPDLPPRFDRVIRRGVAKDKTQRPSSVSAFAEEICEAFGLSKELDKWSKAPLSEIETALTAGTPRPLSVAPPPKPEPVVSEADGARPTIPMDQNAGYPKKSSKMGVWVALAVACAIALGLAIAFLS